MRKVGLVLVAWVLSACASSQADWSLDAAAKLFRAPADKACLYIVPIKARSEVIVTMDGRKIGRLVEANFLRLDVPPGRHVLYVTPPNPVPLITREAHQDLTLETEAGRCYFLRAVAAEDEEKWLQYRIYLERMTDAEGQREVNVRRLAVP